MTETALQTSDFGPTLQAALAQIAGGKLPRISRPRSRASAAETSTSRSPSCREQAPLFSRVRCSGGSMGERRFSGCGFDSRPGLRDPCRSTMSGSRHRRKASPTRMSAGFAELLRPGKRPSHRGTAGGGGCPGASAIGAARHRDVSAHKPRPGTLPAGTQERATH